MSALNMARPDRTVDMACAAAEASHQLMKAQQYARTEADYTVLRIALDLVHPLTVPTVD